MISAKVHRSSRIIVALCDVNLLGKRFQEDKLQIEIRTSFFQGKELSYEKAVEIMRKEAREDATFNLVGDETIKAALEAGIIQEEGIIKIQGVPVALVLL